MYDMSQYSTYEHLNAFFLELPVSSQPITIIGWSWGAMVSLELAYKFPQKINKLILISGTAKFINDNDYVYGTEKAAVKNLSDKVRQNPLLAQKAFYKQMFSPAERTARNIFFKTCIPDILVTNNLSLQTGLNYLLTKDLRKILPFIKVPTQIIHGTDDIICPFSAAEYLHKALPDSQLAVLPCCGHIPFFTQRSICQKLLFK